MSNLDIKFKRLTPFKRCVLQNFPFIEADFDALTNYGLLCKIVEYLNQVIASQNEVQGVTEELVTAFNNLYDYVKNYFDNLDVQDEIDHKLDEMAEDGTLAEIINEEIFGDLLTEIGDSHNPIHYGADPTGVEDSTQAINNCIQANKGGTVQFTQGVYKVTDQILLPYKQDEKVSIYGNGATIKAFGDIEYLFFVGYDKLEGDLSNDVGFTCNLKDLYIDGTDANIEYCVYNVKGFKDLHLDNVNVYRCKNGILIADVTGSPADVLWQNSIIYGKGSEYEGTGVIVNGSDNYFSNMRIYGFRVGFEVNAYCTIDTTHVLLRWAEQTTENPNPYPVGSVIFNGYYEQTMFANLTNSAKISGSYADSTYKFLNIDTNSYIMLSNSFYYNSRSGIDQHVIDCTKQDTKLIVSACEFSLKQATNVSIIRCTHTSGYFSGYAQLSFNSIEIRGIANLTNRAEYALLGYDIKAHQAISVTADTWYVAGAIINIPGYLIGELDLYINSRPYSLRFNSNGENPITITQYNASENNDSYTVGFVRDTAKNIIYVCFKHNTGTTGLTTNVRLNSTNYLSMAIELVNGDSMFTSSRLLSDYTDAVPQATLRLSTIANQKSSS